MAARARRSKSSKVDVPTKTVAAPLSTSELSAVVEVVRREGSVAVKALQKEHGIAKANIPELLERLADRSTGLEVTPKTVRVPLAEQLTARLSNAGALPLRGAHDALSGASKKEAMACVDALIEEGEAHSVVRSTEVVIVRKGADTLDPSEFEALERTAETLAKTLKLARKKKATLLRSDVQQAVARFAATGPKRATSATTGSIDELAKIVDRHREKSGLTFVPNVVRALGGVDSRSAVHAALLRGANTGIYELRPESGLARLSQEDLSFCIPGPQGSRLSWVRRIED